MVFQVPLLDMMKYHTLLAGNSWMGEYGNPDDPDMMDILLGYSPYHQVTPSGKYPEVFFITSTKDDRVHPYHARAMVARMRDYGHPVLYYEAIEGGHGAAANLKQYAFNTALHWTYLKQKLYRPALTMEQQHSGQNIRVSELSVFAGSGQKRAEAPEPSATMTACCNVS